MSKKLILAGAAVLSFAAAPQAAQAVTLSTTFEATGALPGYTTAGVFQGFNQATGSLNTSNISFNGTTISQSVSSANKTQIYSGSVSGEATAPFLVGSTPTYGNFMSIQPGSGNNGANAGSYTLNFTGTAVHFLSFVFSTLDPSNQVTLNTSGGNLTLSGAQILSGNPAGSTTTFGSIGADHLLDGRVSYNFGLDQLNSITFTATGNQFAFEIDEIALAAPEPATWAMMLLGFGLVGSQLRRRGRKPVLALASA